MKRMLMLVLILLLAFSASNAFAQNKGWAIGGAFALDWGFNNTTVNGAALCLKFPGLPVMFGFSANFNEPLRVGVTADWWLFQTNLVGPLNLYIGPGLFFRIWTTDPAIVDFGLRIPIGFQIFIVPVFEIFLEPAIAIGIVPDLPTFTLQGAIGFRFWF